MFVNVMSHSIRNFKSLILKDYNYIAIKLRNVNNFGRLFLLAIKSNLKEELNIKKIFKNSKIEIAL